MKETAITAGTFGIRGGRAAGRGAGNGTGSEKDPSTTTMDGLHPAGTEVAVEGDIVVEAGEGLEWGKGNGVEWDEGLCRQTEGHLD